MIAYVAQIATNAVLVGRRILSQIDLIAADKHLCSSGMTAGELLGISSILHQGNHSIRSFRIEYGSGCCLDVQPFAAGYIKVRNRIVCKGHITQQGDLITAYINCTQLVRASRECTTVQICLAGNSDQTAACGIIHSAAVPQRSAVQVKHAVAVDHRHNTASAATAGRAIGAGQQGTLQSAAIDIQSTASPGGGISGHEGLGGNTDTACKFPGYRRFGGKYSSVDIHNTLIVQIGDGRTIGTHTVYLTATGTITDVDGSVDTEAAVGSGQGVAV